jgi:hypothetical protein
MSKMEGRFGRESGWFDRAFTAQDLGCTEEYLGSILL